MVTITASPDGFGALVEGVDLAVVPDATTHAAILGALDEHRVLVFRNGDAMPTDAQVVDFCTRFGPLRPSLADKSRLADFPAINIVSNRNLGEVQGSGGGGPLHYHSDLHHEPPLIEFIYLDALEVPDEGGATVWVDLCAAYDALPDTTKARLDGMVVQYGLRKDLDFDVYFKADTDVLAKRRQSTKVRLVQTNGRTGRKSVWPNAGPDSNHHSQIVGMDADESRALLTELFDFCTQDRFRYRHEWQRGDACLWHNLQTLHGREAFPGGQARMMRHVNITGITDPHQRDDD